MIFLKTMFWLFVVILIGFILFVLMISTYVPTNPADQYKTPIVYHGQTDKIVDAPSALGRTTDELVYNLLYRNKIMYGVIYDGPNFDLSVNEITFKEEALRLLREGIEKGEIYVDDQNYLVTE